MEVTVISNLLDSIKDSTALRIYTHSEYIFMFWDRVPEIELFSQRGHLFYFDGFSAKRISL